MVTIVEGFLKQKCQWSKKGQLDAFGQIVESDPVEIPCRWEQKSGFVRGIMGETSVPSRHRIMVAVPVSEGDILKLDSDTGGKVVAVETIVGVDGSEQGRLCYV